MAFLVGSSSRGFQRLAVPFASLLMATLGYGSQYLFATSPDLEPGPLTRKQTWTFNILLACLWWTYYRACTVDPGRYTFPSKSNDSKPKSTPKPKPIGADGPCCYSSSSEPSSDEETHIKAKPNTSLPPRRRRWCRKCAAPKPPRAHHCKTCGRCIPKMDHHCPWTGNCVSLQTFPHFLRFIIYTNISLWVLLSYLYTRGSHLWSSRHKPAYLGPSVFELVAFTGISLIAGLAALALFILLVTTVKGWALNTTLIESWEIERHEAVLERGGEEWWAAGDGGQESRNLVEPVEFPYDIGIYANLCSAMGTSNPLLWLFPFYPHPRVAKPKLRAEELVMKLETGGRGLGTGWSYAENGMNDREGLWPPVDPEKVRNKQLWKRRRREEDEFRKREPVMPDMDLSPEQEKEAFRRRQERDLQRWRGREEILDELEETSAYPAYPDEKGYGGHEELSRARPAQRIVVDEGRSGWVNGDGEHLGDYGVDEDAEFDDDGFVFANGEKDDEDVPLAQLIRRRKGHVKDSEDT
ncbi:zf-DHHC-domain-containing protein [Xylariaceae sp. FL1272]|nr:zf-DHHC-domain-containing protein [Xylariaceae sp. FL1272]